MAMNGSSSRKSLEITSGYTHIPVATFWYRISTASIAWMMPFDVFTSKVVQEAAAFADRLRRDVASGEPRRLVERAYLYAFGRRPTADELQLGILSDELNAVIHENGAFSILAMPFAGDFGGTAEAHPAHPLTGLLGLAHGESPTLLGCSKAEAVSRIVASCTYVNADPWLVDSLTSRAEKLVDRLPLRVLTFAKDTRFWRVLDNEYREPASAISR